jgi:hypothetical protein
MKPKETARRLIGLDALALMAILAYTGTLHAAPPPSSISRNTTPVRVQITDYDLSLSSFSWSPQGRGQKFDFCVMNKGRLGSKPATVSMSFSLAIPSNPPAIGSFMIPPLSPQETKCGSLFYDFHGGIVESTPNSCVKVGAAVKNENFLSETHTHDNYGVLRLRPLQGVGC